ncbi:hypothetical protein NL676_021719 [Syzygium grande]|nr:hypothetical protein NL676_021719 [Syzygium grande]
MLDTTTLSLWLRFCLFCLVCCPLIPSVTPLSFNIGSFDTDLSDILDEGVAALAYGYVNLTTGDSPHHYEVGRIQYAKPIRMWYSLTGWQADFSTRFSFAIEKGSAHYGDGMTFFLGPVGIPLPPNSAGGYFGLFNASTANEGPRDQIVMIEFDTFANQFDPRSIT